MARATQAKPKGQNPPRDARSGDEVTIGRAAEILGMRHENIAKAIRAGKIKTRPIEAVNGVLTHAIRREDLRKFRDETAARYAASKAGSRRAWAAELLAKQI